MRECPYCTREFEERRGNQVYCCEEHRRAFEHEMNQIVVQMRPQLRRTVRALLRAARSIHKQ